MEKKKVFESDGKSNGLLDPYGQCDNNAISSTDRSDGDNFGTFTLFPGFDNGTVNEDIKDLTVSSPNGTGIGKKYFPTDGFQYTSYSERIRLSESRRHSCRHCNKVFQSHQQLQQHDLVHSGERKYHCSYCDCAFKQLSHLQQHHRIHTGEKPYQCPLDGCDRAFPQLSNLQHHLRKHDKMVPSEHLCCICGSSYPSEAVLRNHVLKIHHAETVSSLATINGSMQSELLRQIPTRSTAATGSLQITPQNVHVITHNQSVANCPEWYTIPPPTYPKPHSNLKDPSLFSPKTVVETPVQKTDSHFQQRKGATSEMMSEESDIVQATCFNHITQGNKSHGKMAVKRKIKRDNVRHIGRVDNDIYSLNKSGLFDTGEVYCFPRRKDISIQYKLIVRNAEPCANSLFGQQEQMSSKSTDSIHHILDGEINQEFESCIKTDPPQILEYHNSNQNRDTIAKLDNNLASDASISGEENTVLCQNYINNDFRKNNQAYQMKHTDLQEQKQIPCNRTCGVGVVGGASRSRKRKLTNPKRICQRDLSTSQSLFEVGSFTTDNDLNLDVGSESESKIHISL